MVALGEKQLTAADGRDRYGLPGPSSVAKAVETLLARGIIVRDGDRQRFDSLFFERWEAQEVAPDLG